MAKIITITIDSVGLTQEQAIVKGLTLVLNETWDTLGKPKFEIIDDEMAVIVEVDNE